VELLSNKYLQQVLVLPPLVEERRAQDARQQAKAQSSGAQASAHEEGTKLAGAKSWPAELYAWPELEAG
jgi:hypothetical protein